MSGMRNAPSCRPRIVRRPSSREAEKRNSRRKLFRSLRPLKQMCHAAGAVELAPEKMVSPTTSPIIKRVAQRLQTRSILVATALGYNKDKNIGHRDQGVIGPSKAKGLDSITDARSPIHPIKGPHDHHLSIGVQP